MTYCKFYIDIDVDIDVWSKVLFPEKLVLHWEENIEIIHDQIVGSVEDSISIEGNWIFVMKR